MARGPSPWPWCSGPLQSSNAASSEDDKASLFRTSAASTSLKIMI